ncbi:MAG: GntR family transcriptional regulator, transcriptional repressor for pyruvate dehydrogenase complex [Clostridia bacterium]|nr:GntR family transcriptional regulator, transcriptional repressor for pyruvate dehydrogenase complex [Clostridia bacterium]
MKDLKPIRTKKIYEEIVCQIKQLISEGKLKPGERLPSERELAENLGVSRASVREALSALRTVGVLEIRPGEGTFVQNIRDEAIIEPLAMALLLDSQAAMEILEVRLALEGQAAHLAAERVTSEDLKKMDDLLVEMEQNLYEGVTEDVDLNFHLAIAEAARNSVLLRLMRTVYETMRQVLRTSRQRLYTTPGNPELLLKQHKQILKALEKHDPEAAREAIIKHSLFVEKVLRGE